MKITSQPVQDPKGAYRLPDNTQVKNVTSVITFNPLDNVDAAEYSHSEVSQRGLYIKSQCLEAERVIAVLSKMLGGNILNMKIEKFNLSVPCILQIDKKLTDAERAHILSISRNLQITRFYDL
jgi:hypothetical protein